MGRHKYPPAVEQEITRRFVAGERGLGKVYGCGHRTILDIAYRHSAPHFPRGNRYREFSDAEIDEMARRWAAGESQTAIATALKTKQTVVSRVLRQRGIVVRPRIQRGAGHGRWKGGRVVDGRGYIHLLVPPDHPLAAMRDRAGYVLEHRLVVAQRLGRPLRSNEHVHHLDGNRQHNAPENLQLMRTGHSKGQVLRCRCCGSYDIEAVTLGED